MVVQQLEILNSEVHQDLRMRTDPGIPHPHFISIVMSEFPAAACICPIFFAKNAETGDFYAAALFGFKPGEMLVEQSIDGGTPFRPLDLQRQGFFASEENIAIDPAHPRFATDGDIALFEEDGTPSNALRKMQRAIGQLVSGAVSTRRFMKVLLRLDLVEPVDISLEFDDGEHLSLAGLYSISRDSLNDLPDHEILMLFRTGYLQAAVTIANSLNQVSVLAGRRNERLTARP